MATLLVIPASAMVGDGDAQLVGGDAAATFVVHKSRLALAFDDTVEEAAITMEMEMPSQYTGSGLTAKIHWAAETDTTNDVRWEIYVEAKTPNADTLDMEAATSFAVTANAVSDSASGSTAGDPLMASVALTNDDGLVAGDLVRFGIRRDCDYATGDNDDIVNDTFLYSLTIEDDG